MSIIPPELLEQFGLEVGMGKRVMIQLPPPDCWITLRELCTDLGISDKTARRMIARGEMKGVKVGRQWRVLLPEKLNLHVPFRGIEGFWFLRGTEVAELLQISPRAVRQMAKSGRIEFEWIGKKRAYSVAAVRKALVARLSGGKRPSASHARQIVMEWAKRSLKGDPRVASWFDALPERN